MKKIVFCFLIASAILFFGCSSDDEVTQPDILVENFQVTHTLIGGQSTDTIKVSAQIKNINTQTLVYARVSNDSGFLSDFQLFRTTGDSFVGKTILYNTDISSGVYTVKLYIASEPTNFAYNINITWASTNPTGTLAASMSPFLVTPNSAKISVSYVNQTGIEQSTSMVVSGSVSGIQTITIPLPATNFATLERELQNLTPNETVSVQLKKGETLLATKTFTTPVVSYNSIVHTTNGSSTTASFTPNQTMMVSKTVFIASGKTSISSVSFLVKSNTAGIFPWNRFLLIGEAGNNAVINTNSSWTNLGDGWYRITIPGNTAIVSGSNQKQYSLTSSSYSTGTPANFSLKVVFTDAQGVSFETTTTNQINTN